MLVFSVVFGVCFYLLYSIDKSICSYFIAGALPAIFSKHANKYLKNNINSYVYSVLILVLFYFILTQSSSESPVSLMLSLIIFVLFTSGNSLFGILKNSVLKFLGEIAFSIYLLHTILLFNVFYFGFSFESVKKMSAIEYWSVIYIITPFLILFSFLGYYYVEKPFMQKAKEIIQKRQIKALNKNVSYKMNKMTA